MRVFSLRSCLRNIVMDDWKLKLVFWYCWWRSR